VWPYGRDMDYQKYKGIQNTLREHRKRLGLTQKQVAELLKTDPDWICHWERGDALPNLISAMKLSAFYRTTIELLYPNFFKKTKNQDFE